MSVTIEPLGKAAEPGQLGRAQTCGGPHRSEDFRKILEHERLRADRSRLPFSMIEMELPGEPSAIRCIVALIQDRIRATDVMGWLDDGKLGIITPYTDGQGATVLTRNLLTLFPPGVSEPEIRIYEYETATPVRREEVKPAESSCDTLIRRGDVDDLFVRATPAWKRLTDVLGAMIGLILLSPLFLIVAIGIKLCSPGPVFFVQRRTGVAGKPFRMYKFRTMVVDAEERQQQLMTLNEQDGPAFKMERDPRITPIGHWLRRLSVDELPQLCNVLKGDMSLVGPRPLPCAESAGCKSWQRQRLTVTPGMTCSWQVLDRSTLVPFDQWMRMDVRYAISRSPTQDLKLLIRTVLFIIGLRGR